MANLPNFYRLATTVTARKLEVPNANFDNGVNVGGSNSPVIGVATDHPNLTGDPSGWTLLDQRGGNRIPQESQHIGGDGTAEGSEGFADGNAELFNNSDSGDGSGGVIGTQVLSDLATGWESA